MGNCTFVKLPLGKLHIWEIATWEKKLGKISIGKIPLGIYLTSKDKANLRILNLTDCLKTEFCKTHPNFQTRVKSNYILDRY